ncbi:MAG: hypothetical protein ABJC36_02020 [Gemmatimonadales bacterium]
MDKHRADPGVSRVQSLADIDALITDTAAVAVVDADDRKLGALGRLNRLRRLSLEGPSRVTDAGLSELVVIPLEALDLSGSRAITDLGLGHLRLIRSLRRLRLTGCERLTPGGVDGLRAALPRCEIEA